MYNKGGKGFGQEPVLHSEGRSIDGLANLLFSTESQGNHADMIYERVSRYNASSVSKVPWIFVC